MTNKVTMGVVLLALSFLTGCGAASKKSQEKTCEETKCEGASCDNTNLIVSTLKQIKSKGVAFGHQDDLAYGVTWKSEKGNSDVKRVCGDYPAMFGWELGGIERGDTVNLDGVNFQEMHDLAVFGHVMGGINTFSWHPFNVINGESSWNTDTKIVDHILPGGSHCDIFKKQLDVVAEFFSNLKDKNGNQIPFIFRPWHEMDGSWFWWGDKHCTHQQFKDLFTFSIDYLKNVKGVKGMVVAYSPDRNFNTAEQYLTWYPGDKYVDILGMDNYGDLKEEVKDGEKECIRKLHIIIDLANEKGKISALTETGLSFVTNPKWYSEVLGSVLADEKVKSNISYAMVWRNDPNVHYYFPYPGHEAEQDAASLLARDYIFTMKDLKK